MTELQDKLGWIYSKDKALSSVVLNSRIFCKRSVKYIPVSELSMVFCSGFRFGRLINRDIGILPDSFSGQEDMQSTAKKINESLPNTDLGYK